MDVMVSVTLLTYNHADYVRQTLEGIVKQKTNFKFEVIVGDDCSKDNTQEILKEYWEKYPDIFNMVLRPENIGATKNLYDLLKRCKGKYIAGLEGDDYWTDENKLQYQVDFLESHPEYIGCSHDVVMIDQNGDVYYQNSKYLKGCHWTFFKNEYTYEDYQNWTLPGQGSTYLYRNIFLNPKHDYSIIEKASPMVGDMTLMLLIISQGKWYFMKGVTMTAYRYITYFGGTNWASWIRTKNRSYVDFLFRYNLENYARNVLHRKLNLFPQKLELYRNAESAVKWSGGKENEEIFENIKRIAKPHFKYALCNKLTKLFESIFLPTITYAIRVGEVKCGDEKLNNSTWKEFKKATKGKTIVGFGSGLAYNEFFAKYGKKYSVPCILENNKRQIWICRANFAGRDKKLGKGQICCDYNKYHVPGRNGKTAKELWL